MASATQTLVLGGGCFWCTESVFLQVRGVEQVESGYCNGHAPNPTYAMVSTGTSGHNEVVRLVYDPAQVSLQDLLEVFFLIHDPTTLNRQGHDVGTQYRSGIYCTSQEQLDAARAMVQACRFPQLKGVPDYEPQGKRGVGYGWAARQWGISGGEYADRADLWPLDPKGELVLWVMIESEPAVENIRAIAAVPGIGGLFIGPSDLAFSLGVPLGDPAVETAIETIVAAAKEAKIPLGTLCGGNEVEKRLAQGFQFLAVGSDGGVSGSVQDAVKKGRAFKAK
jgi:methionine-S-sulfoxide reductase